MVIGRSRYPAAAIGAQVDADHAVILGELGRERSPHQARAGEAVYEQNRWSLSIAMCADDKTTLLQRQNDVAPARAIGPRAVY